LEQITGAKVEAVKVPSRQKEQQAQKQMTKQKRAANKKKVSAKTQEEVNRVNSERFMHGFLVNRRVEPLEKGDTPKGDG
jgi:hypothetical protein